MKHIKWIVVAIMMAFLGSVRAQGPYMVAEFGEGDLETLLGLCRRGGYESLVHPRPFASYGHYEWNEAFAPEGTESVRRMVQTAAEAGVRLGVLIQPEAISTNDAFFAPEYYPQLRREGQLSLFDELEAHEPDIAVRRSEIFRNPSSLNLILIDKELVSFGTMEFAGDLVLLHHCTRGAYGTKSVAHGLDAKMYKLWDSPERFVAPSGDLLETVRQQLANRLEEAGLSLVLLQGEAGQEMLDESIRVNHVDRWEKEGVPNGSLGWFVIHPADKKRAATNPKELEWLLAKAASFDAGYGLYLDMRSITSHGALFTMLEMANQWGQLTESHAFTEAQKEMMRDPYTDWHLQKQEDGPFLLYPTIQSRRYRCSFADESEGVLTSERWEWSAEEEGGFGLRIWVDGEVSVTNPMVNTEKGLVLFTTTIAPGQWLLYDEGETAYLMDADYNVVESVAVEGLAMLPEGKTETYFICEVANEGDRPSVSLRYITRGRPEVIYPNK